MSDVELAVLRRRSPADTAREARLRELKQRAEDAHVEDHLDAERLSELGDTAIDPLASQRVQPPAAPSEPPTDIDALETEIEQATQRQQLVEIQGAAEAGEAQGPGEGRDEEDGEEDRAPEGAWAEPSLGALDLLLGLASTSATVGGHTSEDAGFDPLSALALGATPQLHTGDAPAALSPAALPTATLAQHLAPASLDALPADLAAPATVPLRATRPLGAAVHPGERETRAVVPSDEPAGAGSLRGLDVVRADAPSLADTFGALAQVLSLSTRYAPSPAAEPSTASLAWAPAAATAVSAGAEAGAVQLRQHGATGQNNADIHRRASEGTATPASMLPHAARILAAFGTYAPQGVRAHIGPEAAAAARDIGAEAYASGEHIVFQSTPSVELVAHELAHVVQQQLGVVPAGMVSTPGDRFERQADEVAARVARGESVEDLFDAMLGQLTEGVSHDSVFELEPAASADKAPSDALGDAAALSIADANSGGAAPAASSVAVQREDDEEEEERPEDGDALEDEEDEEERAALEEVLAQTEEIDEDDATDSPPEPEVPQLDEPEGGEPQEVDAPPEAADEDIGEEPETVDADDDGVAQAAAALGDEAAALSQTPPASTLGGEIKAPSGVSVPEAAPDPMAILAAMAAFEGDATAHGSRMLGIALDIGAAASQRANEAAGTLESGADAAISKLDAGIEAARAKVNKAASSAIKGVDAAAARALDGLKEAKGKAEDGIKLLGGSLDKLKARRDMMLKRPERLGKHVRNQLTRTRTRYAAEARKLAEDKAAGYRKDADRAWTKYGAKQDAARATAATETGAKTAEKVVEVVDEALGNLDGFEAYASEEIGGIFDPAIAGLTALKTTLEQAVADTSARVERSVQAQRTQATRRIATQRDAVLGDLDAQATSGRSLILEIAASMATSYRTAGEEADDSFSETGEHLHQLVQTHIADIQEALSGSAPPPAELEAALNATLARMLGAEAEVITELQSLGEAFHTRMAEGEARGARHLMRLADRVVAGAMRGAAGFGTSMDEVVIEVEGAMDELARLGIELLEEVGASGASFGDDTFKGLTDGADEVWEKIREDMHSIAPQVSESLAELIDKLPGQIKKEANEAASNVPAEGFWENVTKYGRKVAAWAVKIVIAVVAAVVIAAIFASGVGFLTMLAAFAVGAVAAMLTYAISDVLLGDKEWDWKEFGLEALFGGLTGMLGGLSAGSSFFGKTASGKVMSFIADWGPKVLSEVADAGKDVLVDRIAFGQDAGWKDFFVKSGVNIVSMVASDLTGDQFKKWSGLDKAGEGAVTKLGLGGLSDAASSELADQIASQPMALMQELADYGIDKATGASLKDGIENALKGEGWTGDAADNKQADTAKLAAPVQGDSGDLAAPAEGARSVHDVVDGATAGPGSSLPHLSKIQASFGKYDVSDATAHTGAEADAANNALGSGAMARGTDVVLSSTKTDLHTVAHEAAHVVQQKAGVKPAGETGAAGDKFEQNANQVADAVVKGESAEPILDSITGGKGAEGGASSDGPVQGLFGGLNIAKILGGLLKLPALPAILGLPEPATEAQPASESTAPAGGGGNGVFMGSRDEFTKQMQGEPVLFGEPGLQPEQAKGVFGMAGMRLTNFGVIPSGETRGLPGTAKAARSVRIPGGLQLRLSTVADFKSGPVLNLRGEHNDLGPIAGQIVAMYLMPATREADEAFNAKYNISPQDEAQRAADGLHYGLFRQEIKDKPVVFRHPHFQHHDNNADTKPYTILDAGVYSGADLPFGGEIQSIQVPNGLEFQVYSEPGCGGEMTTLTKDQLVYKGKVGSLRIKPPGAVEDDAKANLAQMGDKQNAAAEAMKALGSLDFTNLGPSFARILGRITDVACDSPGKRATITVDVAVPILPPIELRVIGPVTMQMRDDGKKVVNFQVTAGPQIGAGIVSASLQVGGAIEADGGTGEDAWGKVLHTLIGAFRNLDRDWADYVGSKPFADAVRLADKVTDKVKKYGERAMALIGADGGASFVENALSEAKRYKLSELLARGAKVDDLIKNWKPGEYIEDALVVGGKGNVGGKDGAGAEAGLEQRNAVRRTKGSNGEIQQTRSTTEALTMRVNLSGITGLSLTGRYELTYTRHDNDSTTLNAATLELIGRGRIPLDAYDLLLSSSSGVLADAVQKVGGTIMGGPTEHSRHIGRALQAAAQSLTLDASSDTADALKQVDREAQAAGVGGPTMVQGMVQDSLKDMKKGMRARNPMGGWKQGPVQGDRGVVQFWKPWEKKTWEKVGDFFKDGYKEIEGMTRDTWKALSNGAKNLLRGDFSGATVGTLKELRDAGHWNKVPLSAIEMFPLDEVLRAVGADHVLEKLPGGHYLRTMIGGVQQANDNGRSFSVEQAAAHSQVVLRATVDPSKRTIFAEAGIDRVGFVDLKDSSGKAQAKLEQVQPVVTTGRIPIKF